MIFVHGCFWHQHADPKCKLARMPKSRLDFWAPKLEANRLRDERHEKELKAAGWTVHIVWECQLGRDEVMRELIRNCREAKPRRARPPVRGHR